MRHDGPMGIGFIAPTIARTMEPPTDGAQATPRPHTA